MGSKFPDLGDGQSSSRRSVLKKLGVGAIAGSAGFAAVVAGDDDNCWTEGKCDSGSGCGGSYNCEVYERTCCDYGTVTCDDWEATGICCEC